MQDGSRKLRMLNKYAAAALFVVALAPALSGCGFTPLYAVAETGGKPALANVHLASIETSKEAARVLEDEFRWRTAGEASDARYDLYLNVTEQAQRLAVQIDDSVTRYNYRLRGGYRLVDRTNGAQTTGRAEAVVSFNVVSSQYSTLFAEKSAREKAALRLVDQIEREILLQLAAEKEAESAAAAALAGGR